MKYAIIATGGKQYKVNVGDEILVDKLTEDKDKSYIFEKVLLVRQDEDVIIGNPYVLSAIVQGKILEDLKGDKITISKFKAKVHYRRKMGFRPIYSKVKIESISVDKVSAPKNKSKTSAKS